MQRPPPLSQLKYATLHNRCPSADERVIESLSAIYPFELSATHLINCCNGLLLFQIEQHYYVCNPLTKQLLIKIHRKITCPVSTDFYWLWDAALAFDPRESLTYRVVHIVCIPIYGAYYIDIFSSETGRWVNHSVTLEAPISIFGKKKCIVYLQGVLYQLSYMSYLVQFDLNQINASAIGLPKADNSAFSDGLIGVSKDCLHFTNGLESSRKISIWFLENRSNWVLKHSMCIDNIPRFNLCHPYAMFGELEPLAFDGDAEAIFFGCSDGLLRFGVGNRTLQMVQKPIFAKKYYFFTYFPCVEILKDFPPT